MKHSLYAFAALIFLGILTLSLTVKRTASKVTGFTLARTSKVVNVKFFGAKGDGITDDTQAIQKAIDETSKSKVTLFFPKGIYIIKSHIDNCKELNYLRNEGGILIKSNSHLKLDPLATLKAVSNGERQYNIVRIWNGQNITIEGGTILGERNTHRGDDGEWGYGLAIFGSKNIIIKKLSIKDCWGDGINLQVSEPEMQTNKNIIMRNVICSNNRRQGMSIEAGENLAFENCIFEKTHGTAPKSGVDIEPWNQNVVIRNIKFYKCSFKDNFGNNFLINYSKIINLVVDRCTFTATKPTSVAQHIYSTSSNNASFTISNCYFDNNVENILLRGGKGKFLKNQFNQKVTINYPEDKDEINKTDSIYFEGNKFTNVVLLASKLNKMTSLKNNEFVSNNTLFLNNDKSVVIGNKFYNNSESKFIASSKQTCLLLENNTFQNNATAAVEVYNNATIKNNSFINAKQGILVFPAATNVTVKGNSFKKMQDIAINFLDENLSRKNKFIHVSNNISDANEIINPRLREILQKDHRNVVK